MKHEVFKRNQVVQKKTSTTSTFAFPARNVSSVEFVAVAVGLKQLVFRQPPDGEPRVPELIDFDLISGVITLVALVGTSFPEQLPVLRPGSESQKPLIFKKFFWHDSHTPF